MTNGLCPRRDKQSNWEKNPSRSDMVYLTVAYPFYYALCHEGLAGVVEIEARGLDRKRFFPDEDFLTNAITTHGRQDSTHIGKKTSGTVCTPTGNIGKRASGTRGTAAIKGRFNRTTSRDTASSIRKRGQRWDLR